MCKTFAIPSLFCDCQLCNFNSNKYVSQSPQENCYCFTGKKKNNKVVDGWTLRAISFSHNIELDPKCRGPSTLFNPCVLGDTNSETRVSIYQPKCIKTFVSQNQKENDWGKVAYMFIEIVNLFKYRYFEMAIISFCST